MLEHTFDLRTADGNMDTYQVRPRGSGPWPTLIFYMDGLGVRPVLRGMAQRLAAQGYCVLLPNLYYRGGRADTLDLIADNTRMAELFASLDGAKVAADTAALLAHIDTESTAHSAPVGCLGYCMGGRFALGAAGHFPERVAAAASIHGAQLVTDQADSPHLLAPCIRAELYIAVAEHDPWLQAGETAHLRAALDAAGCRYEIEMYTGVGHGFAVAGLPHHDQAASEHHWQRLLELFRRTLPITTVPNP